LRDQSRRHHWCRQRHRQENARSFAEAVAIADRNAGAADELRGAGTRSLALAMYVTSESAVDSASPQSSRLSDVSMCW